MKKEQQNLESIPQPKEKLLVGNVLDIDRTMPTQSMMQLAYEYGPIFQLHIPGGKRTIIISGFELVNEICDDKRFDKKLSRQIQALRPLGGDGLFTATTQEPNWRKAHNILLPNFGMRSMKGYMPMMVEIAEQLLGKWSRLNSDDEIDVVSDMTRLTLDTIGLCGFGYRFNSFYRDSTHPFVESMMRALTEAMDRMNRLPVEDMFAVAKRHQLEADIALMNSTVDRIIQERRTSGDFSQKKDLLSSMLTGVDKQTNEKLDDVNIRYQIITFLIAGHETTSGLLSLALYHLMSNPETLKKAYEEVDRVLGPDMTAPTFDQVNQLRYITQVLKETLRLWPTAPVFTRSPYEETVIGGKYKVMPDDVFNVLLPMLHRDRSIWGDNVEEFDPDRFAPGLEQQRPANAYKPFGDGQRACIGRQFAMQEATLALGMILQRFELINHTNYKLKIHESLTRKPEGFKIQVKKRQNKSRTMTRSTITAMPEAVTTTRSEQASQSSVPRHGTPLLVLFGSNMGTAEELAHRIGEDAERMGFASTVADLDESAEELPKEGAVVIVTASYNGAPPDNAKKFYDWLRSKQSGSDALRGVNYTVFGCGNTDWAATFQAVPRFIDSSLECAGARRIYALGEGNAKEDFDGQFEEWYRPLWGTLFKELHIDASVSEARSSGPLYKVEIVSALGESPLAASLGARPAKVLVNRELQRKDGTHPAERSTRHIELELPEEVTYRAGWHLGVVPTNPSALVERVARRFSIGTETYVRLHKSDRRKAVLPTDAPILVASLLADYVELQDVATRKQIKILADYTECPPEKKALLALCGEDEASAQLYRQEVLAKRKSLIDLLEEFPACELPFNIYLEQLPALRPRYYSISSSPLQDARRCSITVAVVDAPARSGHGQYRGICSSYLQNIQEGEYIHAFVHDMRSSFILPERLTTPLIMVGPGTGLAPFRGFLQERAVQQAQGEQVGETLLFFGCRHPEQDFLYEDELRSLLQRGITELHVAFSRLPSQPKTYVQDLLWTNRARVWALLEQGAVVYVCGDAGAMAPAVRKAFANLYCEMTGHNEQQAEQWLTQLTDAGHYLVDVWPS